jgi:Ca2+/Na+ antiporter
MGQVIRLLSGMVNNMHDTLILIFKSFGLSLSDKDMHFWVIGVIGIIIFFLTDALFKMLAKWNISAVSFIYTFTVLIVLVFSVEIQQKITGRGNMELTDATVGLKGFLAFFGVYAAIVLLVKLGIWTYKKIKENL